MKARVGAKLMGVATLGLFLASTIAAQAQSQAQVQGSQFLQAMMQMATRSMGGPYERPQPGGPLVMNPAVALNPVTMWAPMMTMANPYVFMPPLMSTALMNPATYTPFMNPMAYAAMLNPLTYTAPLRGAPQFLPYAGGTSPAQGVAAYPGSMPTMMDPDAYAQWYARMQESIMKPEQYREMFERLRESMVAVPKPGEDPRGGNPR